MDEVDWWNNSDTPLPYYTPVAMRKIDSYKTCYFVFDIYYCSFKNILIRLTKNMNGISLFAIFIIAAAWNSGNTYILSCIWLCKTMVILQQTLAIWRTRVLSVLYNLSVSEFHRQVNVVIVLVQLVHHLIKFAATQSTAWKYWNQHQDAPWPSLEEL